MHCCTQCPQPCSRPPPTHASAGDSWTLRASLGQSLVGSRILSPGSWYTQGSVYALQESVSQSCVSSGGSMVGLMVTSSKRAYAIPRPAAPRAPAPQQSTADLYLLNRQPNTVLAQSLGSLGPGVHKVCLNTLSVWQVRDLILNVISPLLPSCWGFSFALGCGVSPQMCSSAVQPPLQRLPSC